MSSSATPSASTHNVPVLDPHELKVYQISGSSAGASSGDFHLHRNLRHAEHRRIEAMDAAYDADVARRDFERKRSETAAKLAAETAKKADKRHKRKQHVAAKKLAEKKQKLLPTNLPTDGSFLAQYEAQKLAKQPRSTEDGAEVVDEQKHDAESTAKSVITQTTGAQSTSEPEAAVHEHKEPERSRG